VLPASSIRAIPRAIPRAAAAARRCRGSLRLEVAEAARRWRPRTIPVRKGGRPCRVDRTQAPRPKRKSGRRSPVSISPDSPARRGNPTRSGCPSRRLACRAQKAYPVLVPTQLIKCAANPPLASISSQVKWLGAMPASNSGCSGSMEAGETHVATKPPRRSVAVAVTIQISRLSV